MPQTTGMVSLVDTRSCSTGHIRQGPPLGGKQMNQVAESGNRIPRSRDGQLIRAGANPIGDKPGRRHWVLAQRALPHHGHSPASIEQSCDVSGVAAHIRGELLGPKIDPCAGNLRESAVMMTMPEAPMHEDRRPPLRKDDVWLTGQFTRMKAIPESKLPEALAQSDFRTCVLRTHPGHQQRSHFGSKNVSHQGRITI